MLRICDHSGCGALTLGRFCVLHEPPVESGRFPRGRPFGQQPGPGAADNLGDQPRQPPLLAAAAAEERELAPIRAVFLEGGS
jgi:hypothetical protein